MRSPHIRIIGLLLLIYIFYVKNWTLMPYWLAMMVSLEVLNKNRKYINQPYYQFYNALFMGYLILVTGDRIRSFRLDAMIEWSFNSLMHILFGMIVCFKISQYLMAFDLKISKRIIVIAIVFNLLGLANEFLQNLMGFRNLWVLNQDAQKDMVMNGIGTFIFILIEYALSHRKVPPQYKGK